MSSSRSITHSSCNGTCDISGYPLPLTRRNRSAQLEVRDVLDRIEDLVDIGHSHFEPCPLRAQARRELEENRAIVMQARTNPRSLRAQATLGWREPALMAGRSIDAPGLSDRSDVPNWGSGDVTPYHSSRQAREAISSPPVTRGAIRGIQNSPQLSTARGSERLQARSQTPEPIRRPEPARHTAAQNRGTEEPQRATRAICYHQDPSNPLPPGEVCSRCQFAEMYYSDSR